MSLEVKSKSKILINLPFIILALIFAIVTARLYFWEDHYYKSKEGSERMLPKSNLDLETDQASVDETPISEDKTNSYSVAYDKPRFMSIEKLGVKNARILPVGLTGKGAISTPNSIFDVGWYTGTLPPLTGKTALFVGHNGGPTAAGVFKHLDSLVAGDQIQIEMGDGTKLTYRVYENQTVALADANEKMSAMLESPVTGQDSISIITCTGTWSDVQKTYLSRQFLRATLVQETTKQNQ